MCPRLDPQGMRGFKCAILCKLSRGQVADFSSPGIRQEANP
jgi:hypothetical protein